MLLMHDVRKKTVWQRVGEWLRRIDIPMTHGRGRQEGLRAPAGLSLSAAGSS